MTPHTIVRSMRLEDIPQVVAIDRASFTLPWSPNTYQFEINNRDTSHLVVLETLNSSLPPATGWQALLRRFYKPPATGELIGYGGCWLIAGEAHISTIAVRPDHRGQGLGELLLVSMLRRAIALEGEYSVLEVRATNTNAQALYHKYEYQVVGQRKGYYRDNNEDALLMEVRPLDAAYQQRLEARAAALAERLSYTDHFTGQPKPSRRR